MGRGDHCEYAGHASLPQMGHGSGASLLVFPGPGQGCRHPPAPVPLHVPHLLAPGLQKLVSGSALHGTGAKALCIVPVPGAAQGVGVGVHLECSVFSHTDKLGSRQFIQFNGGVRAPCRLPDTGLGAAATSVAASTLSKRSRPLRAQGLPVWVCGSKH